MPPDTKDPLTDGSRRSSLEIMRSVLEESKKQRRRQLQTDGGGSINIRQLLRSANLNYNQLIRYLDALEERDFILRQQNEGGLHLEITEKGNRFLEQTDDLFNLLEG